MLLYKDFDALKVLFSLLQCGNRGSYVRFSGLKIASSYAVVGAVVSEWLGGFNGLGVYMTRMRKAYAFDNMFAVIILIIVISLLLLLLVNIISKAAMPWKKAERGNYE